MNETNAVLNRYLLEIGRMPLLSPDQTELGRRIQNGDAAARERMINANLRLVVTIERDYINLGLPLVDLISEGNIGLMQAAGSIRSGQRCQVKHLCRFGGSNEQSKARLPTRAKRSDCQRKRLRKLAGCAAFQHKWATSSVTNRLGAELAEELGIAAEKVARLRRVGLRPESLDAPVGADEQTELGESIPDEQMQTPFESLREKDFLDQISQGSQKPQQPRGNDHYRAFRAKRHDSKTA